MSIGFVDMDGARPLAPRVNAFTQRFWNALAEGSLQTTRCTECARASFPPRQFCPGCGGRNAVWFELSGDATVYAQTVIHAAPSMFAADVPYAVAIVDLAEGLRIVTRLLGDPAGERVGRAARIVVTRYSDGCLFAAVCETSPEERA